MSSAPRPIAHTVIHLPPDSPDWPGVLLQFTSAMAATEGRRYAAWATERMARAVETSDGVVALDDDGHLLGFMLLEDVDSSAELSFPWMRVPEPWLAQTLAEAAVQVARTTYPEHRYLRVERQLLPGQMDTRGLLALGFACHWRQRMCLELYDWAPPAMSIPPGYRIVPWRIDYLDMAAEVIFRANENTLDALLYAPFFGESPAQCRRGLLAILVGKFGSVHPEATCCAFHGERLVGLNLVVDEEARLASIVELSVDPDHQRRGLARALMLHSLTTLKRGPFDRAELAVTKANTQALGLYESLGFMEFGQFAVCIGPGMVE